MKLALLLALAVTAGSSRLEAQVVVRNPDRPRTPVVPVTPVPQVTGRFPNIGRLPLFAPMHRLGTACVPWTDAPSMRQIGIARGWQLSGAQYRLAFVGVDANGRVRYVMDQMQDLAGPYPDREQATVQFFPSGRVEIGRRGAWNIGHDAARSLPQVAALFASDSSRAYSFARSLLQLCADAGRR